MTLDPLLIICTCCTIPHKVNFCKRAMSARHLLTPGGRGRSVSCLEASPGGRILGGPSEFHFGVERATSPRSAAGGQQPFPHSSTHDKTVRREAQGGGSAAMKARAICQVSGRQGCCCIGIRVFGSVRMWLAHLYDDCGVKPAGVELGISLVVGDDEQWQNGLSGQCCYTADGRIRGLSLSAEHFSIAPK